MKTINKIRTLCAMTLLVLGLAGHESLMAQPGYGPGYGPQPGYDDPYAYGGQPGYGASPQMFFNELAPYGQWVPNPTYGQVWIPSVAPGFQPYATNGHWVVTEYGNTWVSDYPWGWAPFHYGRWYMDPYYGWAWIPGSEWGPAWVSWRSGGGYYGWAPLGPGMGINVTINIPSSYWVFVPQIYITSPQVYSYYVPRRQYTTIYQNTTIINNVYQYNNRSYVYGPRREEIERYTRSRVPVYRVDNINRPGRAVVGNGSVGIYRPEMGGRGGNWADANRGGNGRYNNDGFTNRGNFPDRTTPAYPGGSVRTNRDEYNGNFGNTAPASPRADRGNNGFTPNTNPANNGGWTNDPRNGDSRNGDFRNGGGWNNSRNGDSRNGDSRGGDFQNNLPRANRSDNPFSNGGGQSPAFNRSGMGGEGGQPRTQPGGQQSTPQPAQSQPQPGGFQGGRPGGRGPR